MDQYKKQSATGLIAVAGMLGLLGVGMMSACNSNPVMYLSSSGGLTVTKPTPVGGQIPMDILWVIDNSFSMCQEQKVLRDNFNLFIQSIRETNLDFHIGVTTTHAPESDFTIEPIAREGVLQATPQPVPGNNMSCLRGEGMVNGQATAYAPFRESLEIAKSCLEDPAAASSYDWTDNQIDCALRSKSAQQSTGCLEQTGLTDRNSDGLVDSFDLFPAYSEYRQIPKVLRAQDYLDQNGNLDAEKLRQDFACMSSVGTRGDGYEKGLRAAVKAVSRELTGGPAGFSDSDASKPNHGLLRREAGFALIFVTDENDCSHDGSLQELGNACGNDVCEYHNSSAVSEVDSVLIPPEQFAEELRNNLAASKGIDIGSLTEDSLLVASINGTWKRFDQPFPSCSEGDKPDIQPVCQSALGEAFSGDRYERFIRQFRNHYPNSVVDNFGPDARLDFTKVEPFGWMCSDTFGPALQAIGEFIVGVNPSCVTDDVLICEDDGECPTRLGTDTRGTCREFPGKDGQQYCDSGIVLALERNPDEESQFPEIDQQPYCINETIGTLDSSNPSCVIDYGLYQWIPCTSGQGIQYAWNETPAVVQNKLSGYTLKVIYNVSIIEDDDAGEESMEP